jgi:polysaccharide biosynthesis/export protein
MRGRLHLPQVLRGGIAIVMVALLWGCAPGANEPMLPQYSSNGYRLGGGDQVRIITFGEDQLTGEFSVDDQGKIALPLLGTTQATGLTPEQLGQEIATGLEGKHLLRDASVAVQVLTYRPIFVLGEVNKPGQYAYQPGMTMLTAVAIAGGFTYRAVEDYASDVRTVDGRLMQGNVTPGSFLAPGDVLKIYERRF